LTQARRATNWSLAVQPRRLKTRSRLRGCSVPRCGR
jgi:hypothetical protein